MTEGEQRPTSRPLRRAAPSWFVDEPHALEVDEVLRRLDVDEEVGLDAREVERRRVVGRNALEQRRQLSGWSILWDQMRSAAVLLLTVLSPTAWAVALSLATVPLVLTQTVRVWRDRGTVPHAGRRSGAGAGSR
ncbi:MAG TPA: cation-transporting P-type ATPase [Acidimicrobiia bacterium]|nr:cation-transporting P-type ATPase [Acidimicrobiia bacterium]